MTCFTLDASDGAARAGTVHTAHGDIPTPAFMPVGTKATVKALHPDEVRETGASVILGNTYHLHFRPGEALIEELGGLHAFSGWDGPILTDSGGFQVFSLRDTLLEVDDDGVTFRSVYDGSPARFTPESAARIQANLGSDIAMCLDICPPADVSRCGSMTEPFSVSRIDSARPASKSCHGCGASVRTISGSSPAKSLFGSRSVSPLASATALSTKRAATCSSAARSRFPFTSSNESVAVVESVCQAT